MAHVKQPSPKHCLPAKALITTYIHSLRLVYLGSLEFKSRHAMWNFGKGTRLSQIMGHRRPIFKAEVHQDCKGFNPITNQSIYTIYIEVNIMAENKCI
jgi:hypothetical protein